MSQHIYFPGLNGVRFIAAAAVIIAHIEGFLMKSGNVNYSAITHILGPQGVSIFFVLSGFLITYLCLAEVAARGAVDIKKFYLRRVLRIWPLYFLILAVGYFILPYSLYPSYFKNPLLSNYWLAIILSILFLPNLVLLRYGSFFGTGVLWSIGIEEQFYLFWPWFINKVRSLKYLLVILAIYVGIKVIAHLLNNVAASMLTSTVYNTLYIIVGLLQHDSILTGCFFGFVLHASKTEILSIIYKLHIQLLAIVGIVLTFIACKLNDGHIYEMQNVIYAIFYGILITNISSNKNSIIKLDNPVFNYLGKISYGLYMYHSLIIALCILLLKYSGLNSANMLTHIAIYVFVFVITILVAALSYTYFETPILRYKKVFEVLSSGNKN